MWSFIPSAVKIVNERLKKLSGVLVSDILGKLCAQKELMHNYLFPLVERKIAKQS